MKKYIKIKNLFFALAISIFTLSCDAFEDGFLHYYQLKNETNEDLKVKFYTRLFRYGIQQIDSVFIFSEGISDKFIQEWSPPGGSECYITQTDSIDVLINNSLVKRFCRRNSGSEKSLYNKESYSAKKNISHKNSYTYTYTFTLEDFE
jgi:hypothetical protein